MLPLVDDLDKQVEQAEAEVMRADERVSRGLARLKRRWSDRMPWVAGLGVAGIAAAFFLLPRHRGPGQAGRRGGQSWARVASPMLNLLMSRGIGMLTAAAAGMAARKTNKPLATVPHVDINRYAGQWFEIARLPISTEKKCERDVTAHYEVRDGGLRVTNRCRQANGRMKTAVGHARLVDTRTQAKLQISFAPSFLDALPFVWADYWILELADDYSAAMVGTPDRRFLWLLGRTPSLPGTALNAFLARAEQQGFDTSKLEYTEHTVRHAPPTATEMAAPESAPAESRPASASALHAAE
jgi:apolipoprotein D and lipocalin family protein